MPVFFEVAARRAFSGTMAVDARMPEDHLLEVARDRIGSTLRGKYRLDRVLGVGGMGAVYVATHRNNKQFAIKMLHAEISMHESVRSRFLREGYVANSVKHPGAVAVLDDDVAEDGAAFLVMELLDGSAVDEVWTRYARRMPVPLVLSIGDALLDVLTAAHANGIVHRDLKPANLFLTNDGALKVLDFGIARLRDDAGASATVSGAMLGTPAFMSPEQALAKAGDVDAQSDVWSTGATLFTLLSGELVHEGENAPQLLVNVATKPSRSLAGLAPDVPKPIVDVIDRAIAFEKKDRWPSAQAMREALHKASIEGLGTPIATLPKSATPPAMTSTPSGVDATVDASSGRPLASARGVSSGTAFAPTAAAPIEARTPGASTRAAMAQSARRSIAPRSRRYLAAAGLACVAVLAWAIPYRASHVPRVTYCATMVDAIDGPRCVREVGEDAVAKRLYDWTWRVTTVGGRVTKLETVSIAGRAYGHGERHSMRGEITRADDGSVREIVSHDARGNVTERQKWSNGGHTVDFVDEDGATPRHATELGEEDPDTRITTVHREFDSRGLVARVAFFGANGKPRAADDGAYGRVFVNGRLGRPIRTTVLGADGAPAAAKDGSSLTEVSDDDTPGHETRYIDLDGHPMSVGGAYMLRVTFSSEDDQRDTRFFGAHGEPLVQFGEWGGSHEIRFDWDPAKRVGTVAWSDAEGRPRLRTGDTFSSARETLDDRGRMVLQEFLDPNGNRARRHLQNVTAYRWTYDDLDQRVAQEGLDTAGGLLACNEGYAKQTMAHDERGYVVERRNFDESGHLIAARDEGAITRLTYDERGLRTSLAYFGPDDHPTANVHGVSLERSKFDRLRNEIERASFGTDGMPIASDEGFAMQRWTYDANDDLVAESYFDATGAPVLYKGEYATRRITNDDRGLVIEDEYLDLHGERILRRDAYAGVKYVRDRNGDVLLESYFGKRDEPVTNRDCGCAKKKRAYDVHRRLVETALFDEGGAAVTGTEGWSIERRSYDDRGLLVRTDTLDGSGKPALLTDGYASMTKAYDARGNRIEETARGVSGEPVRTNAGFATTRKTYNDRDELIEEARFGTDGKPAVGADGWSLRRTRHDDVGNVVEEAYFNGDHALVMPQGATYASVRSRFDARQRLVEASYLDAHEAPAKGPDGVAVVRYARDTYGRAVETTYLDGAGTPTASIEGKIVVRVKYDDAGRPVDERFVDASAAPRGANDGCAGHRKTFDPQGHKIEEQCFGVDGALAMSADGWSVRRTQYDSRGNAVEIATYDVRGALHADKSGIARTRSTYDERNNVEETAFYDAHDKPTHDSHGIHETVCAYDDTGKKTGEKKLDLRGNAMEQKP